MGTDDQGGKMTIFLLFLFWERKCLFLFSSIHLDGFFTFMIMIMCAHAYRSVCGCVHVSTHVSVGPQRVLDPMDLELQMLASWALERSSGPL